MRCCEVPSVAVVVAVALPRGLPLLRPPRLLLLVCAALLPSRRTHASLQIRRCCCFAYSVMLVVLTAAAKPAGPQTFTVTISKIGDKKVAVMKEIRALTNLSLKDVRARENPLTHVPLSACSREPTDSCTSASSREPTDSRTSASPAMMNRYKPWLLRYRLWLARTSTKKRPTSGQRSCKRQARRSRSSSSTLEENEMLPTYSIRPCHPCSIVRCHSLSLWIRSID